MENTSLSHSNPAGYTGHPPIILHGDSRKITPQLPNGIRAIITDPPYGMGYKSNRATTADGARWAREIEGDLTIDEAIDLFVAAVGPLIPKTLADAEMYVFCHWSYMEVFRWLVNDFAGFEVEDLLVWDKMDHGMGDLKGCWAPTHELCLYAKKGRWLHPNRKDNVIHIPKLRPTEMWHPTQKPVPLLERLIEQSTAKGDLVIDPFAGSGATIKAAQNLGRAAIGIELDKEHHRRAVESLNEVSLASLMGG